MICFLPLIKNCSVMLEATYSKCYHNIIYGSLNINIPLPPPFYRKVWDFKNTDPVCTPCEISLVNWNYAFSNKTADEKVKSLNSILSNSFRNFIPKKVIKVDYKYPNWMNPKIISSLSNWSRFTIRYSNPTKENKNLLTVKSNECSNMIVEAK